MRGVAGAVPEAIHLGSGHRAHWYDVIPSTNVQAMTLAGDARFDSAWICAREQLAGKGRSGRVWRSAKGNLFSSFLFRPGCDLDTVLQLPIVAAVACRSAVANALAHAGVISDLQAVQVKWPNDILLRGDKVGGILIETQHVKGVVWVVIGIGLNLASVPENVDQPVTCLASHGCAMSQEQGLELLSQEMSQALHIWEAGAGFDRIRELWMRYAAYLGCEMEGLDGSGASIAGTFVGLDAQGALLLKSSTGLETITYGDVTVQAG